MSLLELRLGPVSGLHAIDATLTLGYSDRERSRLRVTLSTGEVAALLLPRGTVLRGGQILESSDGRIVQVVAARESVSSVRAATARELTRVAYHLGNRHVPLEIGTDYLRYTHDHVLDAMVRGLGAVVEAELAPFEPESGAYGHSHGSTHSHAGHHEHPHDGESAGDRP